MWEYLPKAQIWERWEDEILLAIIRDLKFKEARTTGRLIMDRSISEEKDESKIGNVEALKGIVERRIDATSKKRKSLKRKAEFDLAIVKGIP